MAGLFPGGAVGVGSQTMAARLLLESAGKPTRARRTGKKKTRAKKKATRRPNKKRVASKSTGRRNSKGRTPAQQRATKRLVALNKKRARARR